MPSGGITGDDRGNPRRVMRRGHSPISLNLRVKGSLAGALPLIGFIIIPRDPPMDRSYLARRRERARPSQPPVAHQPPIGPFCVRRSSN